MFSHRRKSRANPRVAALVLMPLVAAALSGCHEEEPPVVQSLLVSWTFADGRSCADSGVATVTVGPPDTSTPSRFDCDSGRGRPVATGPLPRGKVLVEGISAGGAPLYRAVADVPAGEPAYLDVILVFVGGAPSP